MTGNGIFSALIGYYASRRTLGFFSSSFLKSILLPGGYEDIICNFFPLILSRFFKRCLIPTEKQFARSNFMNQNGTHTLYIERERA